MTPTQRRWAIGAAALLALLLFVGFVSLRRGSHPIASAGHSPANGQPDRDVSRSEPLDKAPASVAIATDLDRRMVDAGLLMQLGRYNDYLDTICPRLSPAEEDLLVEQSNGDPQVLIGLVFAGSERTKKWLEMALSKGAQDPLVHFTVLSRSFPGFDRLKSALALSALAPKDAWPLHIAALESLKRGDRQNVVSYLQAAAQNEHFSSYSQVAQESAMNVFRLAGRPEADARARVLLQRNSQIQAATALELGERLGLLSEGEKKLWGSDQLTALVIDAHQKAIHAPSLDLATYSAARSAEIDYLQAIASASTPRLTDYLPDSPSKMLSDAQREMQDLQGVLFFAQDKPGIYKRLADNEKSELLDRIERDGELSAYRWAYDTRPDIFRMPDFVPQGMPRDYWVAYVNRLSGEVARGGRKTPGN